MGKLSHRVVQLLAQEGESQGVGLTSALSHRPPQWAVFSGRRSTWLGWCGQQAVGRVARRERHGEDFPGGKQVTRPTG